MKSDAKKILIVEFTSGHFELIPAFLYYLKKNGYSIYFAGTAQFNTRFNELLDHFDGHILVGNPLSILELFRIRTFVRKNGISQVLFNSVSGRAVLLLSLLLPIKVQLSGVLHDIDKWRNSNTFRMIRLRIKKYLVLSKFLFDQINPHVISQYKVQYFYPIKFETQDGSKNEVSDSIRILVPGHIQFSRRDYSSLLKSILTIDTTVLKRLKFILLGDITKYDGPKLRKEIEDAKLEANFEFYDSYLADSEFYSLAGQCEYLMPLVHPQNEYQKGYFRSKISGSFNLAFGLKKPLLIHEDLLQTEEFANISTSYNMNSISQVLSQLSYESIASVNEAYDKDLRFEESEQEKRLCSILD